MKRDIWKIRVESLSKKRAARHVSGCSKACTNCFSRVLASLTTPEFLNAALYLHSFRPQQFRDKVFAARSSVAHTMLDVDALVWRLSKLRAPKEIAILIRGKLAGALLGWSGLALY